MQVKKLRVYLESSRVAELPRRKADQWGPFPEYLKEVEAERLAGGATADIEFGNLSTAILRALSRGYKDHYVSKKVSSLHSISWRFVLLSSHPLNKAPWLSSLFSCCTLTTKPDSRRKTRRLQHG